jgi:hypothetical protein
MENADDSLQRDLEQLSEGILVICVPFGCENLLAGVILSAAQVMSDRSSSLFRVIPGEWSIQIF